MATQEFKCPACGTTTEYEYSDGGSYSSMFNEGETVTVCCRNPECRKPVGTVREY
jgi:hypothetical protein